MRRARLLPAAGLCLLLLAPPVLSQPAPPPGAPEGAPGAPAAQPPAAGERLISLNLRDIPFRQAVDHLFDGTGLNFAVEPEVPNPVVTVNIRQQPLDRALRTLVRITSAQVPNLTYAKEGNLYVIKIRQPPPPREGPPPPPAAAVELSELLWEKIPVSYMSVAAMTPLLGGILVPAGDDPVAAPAARPLGGNFGPGAGAEVGFQGGLSGGGLGGFAGGLGGGTGTPSITPHGIDLVLGYRNDNSLIVRGTQDAVQQLKTLVRLMDIPAKQVRVRLTTAKLSAEGRTTNGHAIRLTDLSPTSDLDVRLTPRINGDTTIDLRIEGTLTVNGQAHPLETQVRFLTGRRVELFTLGDGSRATVVTAEATIVEDPLEQLQQEQGARPPAPPAAPRR